MISIRDEDHAILRGALLKARSGDSEACEKRIRIVLTHIAELMLPAPTIEPRIVPLSDEQLKLSLTDY